MAIPPYDASDDQPRVAIRAGYRALLAAGDSENAEILLLVLQQRGMLTNSEDHEEGYLTEDMAIAIFG